MLVLVHVEGLEVEEAVEQGLVEAAEHVEQRQIVSGAAEGGVAERQKGRVAAVDQGLVGLLGRPLQVDDAVGGDQAGGVGPLPLVERSVVHEFFARQRGRLELAVQLAAVAVQHGEVEGPEVGVEVLVDELVVNGEVVGVEGGLGLGAQRAEV